MPAPDFRDEASSIQSYIDDRYTEFDDEQIDAFQVHELTRGAIRKALADAYAQGRRDGYADGYTDAEADQ